MNSSSRESLKLNIASDILLFCGICNCEQDIVSSAFCNWLMQVGVESRASSFQTSETISLGTFTIISGTTTHTTSLPTEADPFRWAGETWCQAKTVNWPDSPRKGRTSTAIVKFDSRRAPSGIRAEQFAAGSATIPSVGIPRYRLGALVYTQLAGTAMTSSTMPGLFSVPFKANDWMVMEEDPPWAKVTSGRADVGRSTSIIVSSVQYAIGCSLVEVSTARASLSAELISEAWV
jgi:hypothetical protein